MILSMFIVGFAFAWLLKETDYLHVRLLVGEIPEHYEPIKRTPILEECMLVNMEYPKPQPIPLLESQCYVTKLENTLTRKYFHTFATGKESYQVMTFGDDTIIVNSHNPKLYDVIAEAQRIVSGKVKAQSYAKLNHQKPFWTSDTRYNSDTGNDEPIYTSNCLFPIDWLEAHYQDIIPEPTMELIVNGKELHVNGNYKTGLIKEFCKANKMVWEK